MHLARFVLASTLLFPTLAFAAPSVPEWDGTLLNGDHTVVLDTSMGDIALMLDADEAPKTVTNFIELAKAGYYDGLTFHRVIPDFMIQGGDPKGDGTGGESIYGKSFDDEINDTKLRRGVIAMANAGPDTNGSQFFIVQADETPWLDGQYTAFGHVTKGMDVVDMIAAVKRNDTDKPVKPVTFTVKMPSVRSTSYETTAREKARAAAKERRKRAAERRQKRLEARERASEAR